MSFRPKGEIPGQLLSMVWFLANCGSFRAPSPPSRSILPEIRPTKRSDEGFLAFARNDMSAHTQVLT
jgi:hypothetical protein